MIRKLRVQPSIRAHKRSCFLLLRLIKRIINSNPRTTKSKWVWAKAFYIPKVILRHPISTTIQPNLFKDCLKLWLTATSFVLRGWMIDRALFSTPISWSLKIIKKSIIYQVVNQLQILEQVASIVFISRWIEQSEK